MYKQTAIQQKCYDNIRDTRRVKTSSMKMIIVTNNNTKNNVLLITAPSLLESSDYMCRLHINNLG